MQTSIAAQLAALDLAGLSVKEYDETTLDMPDPEDVAQTINAVWQEMFGLFTGTGLESAGEDIAWGFVHLFHKAAERQEAKVDRATDEIRMLLAEQDGSEIGTSNLEREIERAQHAETAMGLFQTMREQLAFLYCRETGHSWRPIKGGRNAPGLTAAMVDGRSFLRARAETRRKNAMPAGTPIIFSGGRMTVVETDARDFADNLFGTLDRVRQQVPDMVLVHGGDSKGVDRFAAGWAERNKVPQMVFGLDARLGQKAGFRRNEQMLSLKPRYVIAYPGNGVLERLVIDAKERRISVIDRRGPLGTRPSPSAQQAA